MDHFRQSLIDEFSGMDLTSIPDPNLPFENHWQSEEKSGFNRGFTPKEIHESFRDADGQGSSLGTLTCVYLAPV